MEKSLYARLEEQISEIKTAGLYKEERILATPQTSRIRTAAGQAVLNMCANNYLGLANHPDVRAAARTALDQWGYGMASVRFICGTQEIHRELEQKLARFLGTEDAILYSSCFDANGGLFETLLGEEDCVISDALNHASIIDGIRLCKARRLRYENNNLESLEECLKQAAGSRSRLIATDGVFSMDGIVADLRGVCDLARRYDALVMVDDSHGVGVLGEGGRGSPEHCGVLDRVDIITGTLGKALGGASGGYTAARKTVVDYLRQRSRPYLFSNSLAPCITAASLAALDLLDAGGALREHLRAQTAGFRQGMQNLGFELRGAHHPIAPVMLGDAALAQKIAARLLEKGVYVIGFSYPVVPRGLARIRVQISAAHTPEDIAFAVRMFGEVKAELGV